MEKAIGAVTGLMRGKVLTVAMSVLLVMGALAGAGVAKPQQAEAATYTWISGTVIKADSNSVMVNQPVTLEWYDWSSYTWRSLGIVATTNAYGRYSISYVQAGYTYRVYAGRTYGRCSNPGSLVVIYNGYSPSFYAGTRGIYANVYLQYRYTVPC